MTIYSADLKANGACRLVGNTGITVVLQTHIRQATQLIWRSGLRT